MDTLKKEIKLKNILLIIVFHFVSCNTNNISEVLFLEKSKEVISENGYKEIYNSMSDTLKKWCINKLPSVLGERMWGYYLDSLVCFNSQKNRLITSILVPCKDKKCVQDEIKFLFGEKIHGLWYLFRGPSITIPREMVSNHPIHQPLSYQQLHQIALKEVYGGYLTKNGEINEAWFTSYFEGPDWGDFNDQKSSEKFLNLNGKRFNNKREFFEAIRLQSIKNNWYGVNKDSIKQLPPKTNVP